MRIGFGVAGLLTIENLWRNTERTRRWHVWPLCLAVGGLFAYELFLFSDAFITLGRVDPGLALGRAIVAGIHGAAAGAGDGAQPRVAGRHPCLPPGRAAHGHAWRERLFPPCRGLVAMLLRGFGGDWGLVLQLAMLFGSIVVLATVLSSGNLRRGSNI